MVSMLSISLLNNYGNVHHGLKKSLQKLKISIDNIFNNAYKTEPALKSALDVYGKSTITSFDTAWAIVEGRFDILRDFCGVYTNTASVRFLNIRLGEGCISIIYC